VGKDVIFSDVELFLTGRIRARLAAIVAGPEGPYKALAAGVYVGATFPPTRRPKTVVVRDDGGATTGLSTQETSVGVTVLAGDDNTQGQEATDLAKLVAAIVAGCAGVEPGNPVAAVLSTNGPFRATEESGQPRRYFTANLAVTGKAFDI
jgi:hypothetical protein